MGAANSGLAGLKAEDVLVLIRDYFNARHMTVQDAFRFIDTDNSKYVSWDEFMKAINLCLENTGHGSISHDSLFQVFQRFDVDNNGKLSIEEFAAAFNPSSKFGSSFYDAEFHDRGMHRRSPGVGARKPNARPESKVVDDMVGRLASSVVRTGFTPAGVFNKLDKDGNGRLSQSELEQILLSFDANLSLTERNAIFARFDKDMNGSIDIYEFRQALEHANAGALIAVESKVRFMGQKFKDSGYNLHQCFSVFDRDEDGFLTIDEWKRAMSAFGPELSENDAEAVFRRFDDNGDGLMSIHEFQKFFRDAIERTPTVTTTAMTPISPATSPISPNISPNISPHISTISPTISPIASQSMHGYHAPPVEEPWQTAVLDTVRHHISKAQCGLDIDEVFRRLDLTGSGNMGMYEFDRMITAYRSDLSREHLDSLFAKVNYSGSGAINRGEFIRRFG